MGKGGGGGPTQSTSTSYQTNIPEYARPYVETMLGATQKQLFTTQPGTDASGNPTTEITGFQPYRAFGGTYDASGNQTSYDPSKSVAGFTPMQLGAQQATANLQVPGQYQQAMGITGAGVAGQFGTADQAGGYGGLGAQYGGMGAQAGQRAGMYGGMGAAAGQQGMGYGAQAAQFGRMGAGAGREAGMYGDLGYGAGQQGMQYGAEAGQAGARYAQQATNPYAMQAYMSPYMQGVVDVQQREAQRMSDIAGTQQRSQATQQGAFGGSRQALMEAERQRNLATQQGQIQAQGLQNAYQQAQQAQQFGANLGLQGQQAAMQGAGLGIQGAQAGLQGVQGRLQAAQTGIQGAQAGMQGAGLGIQGAQTGIQGQQAGIQGAQAGMQGAGLGLQGVGAQQAAYAQAMQGGQQLANLGQQQLGAQQSIIGAQNQMGAQQQAYNQQIINQAIQDYANAQQYPLMQLGTMSNMLRGLPMQAQTTNQYVAAPNPITQGIGAAGTYGALKNAGVFAEGGEVKSMAKGGITSIPRYDVGGEVAGTLEDMDNDALKRQAQESSSPAIRRMAQRLLKERAMESGVAPAGPMGVQYKAPGMAKGGILAFAEPTEENNRSLVKEPIEPAEAPGRRIVPAEAPGSRIVPAMPPERPPAAEAPPQAATAPALAAPAPGITGAAPAPAPAPASSELLANIRAAVAKAEEEAAKPESDFLTRVKEGMPVDTETANYRKTVMAERANLEDEKKRQKYMRMAQFFAKWGSTPGPVLVAGMNSVNEMIPGLISDEQEFKKARKESDKIMFDLDRAVRLEELGYMKEARTLKEKAADRAKDLQHYLVQAQTSIEGATMQSAASRYAADQRLAGDKLQAAAHGAGSQATREATAEHRAAVGIQVAQRELNDVRENIDKARSTNKEYGDAQRAIKSYERSLANAKGDEKKVSPALKSQYDKAKEVVSGYNASWDKALKNSEQAVEDARTRWKNLGGEKTGKKPEKAEGAKNDPLGIL